MKKILHDSESESSTKREGRILPPVLQINNRRYLGNKSALLDFLDEVIAPYLDDVTTIGDYFAGTGAVAHHFMQRKQVITNDILYCNYLAHYAWMAREDFNQELIEDLCAFYNSFKTSEHNYMRENFANTYFSADDCSKIGYIRADIEHRYQRHEINFKEYAILITGLLYSLDRIANTVGHYDAYRQNCSYDKPLLVHPIAPLRLAQINAHNQCFNQDANQLVREVDCDLLYLDPPYNSRQYGDCYHLLENIARWEQPAVVGVARKMDRSHLKSSYCTNHAAQAFADLIAHTRAKYIVLSYNNMAQKGNSRSHAKISDADILRILQAKGEVEIFEREYNSFTAGKSEISDNKERVFVCKVTTHNNN